MRADRCRTAVLAALSLFLLVSTTPSAAAPPPVLDDFAAILPQLQPEQRAQLQQRGQQWQAWNPAQRDGLRQRAAHWDALPAAERNSRREQYHAWQALTPDMQARLRAVAARYERLPLAEQRALRERFDALDASTRRGWLLGPSLGADYPTLQPLLAQLPAAQHAPMLQTLRAMTPVQRGELAVLVQRTPPQEREALRRELLSTATAQRQQWLWERLDR
ncbi:MAG: DUF3106 domain-containing protein [Pseudomonadota bacterium]|nr:DUF3106 domain-containing protein [Pseudomonadota bacterium]